jgi:hypothetical protein
MTSRRRLGVAGGALALVVSAGLAVWVVVRGVGLNPFVAWTLLVASVAGLLAMWRQTRPVLLLAAGLLVLAALPAMFAGVGLVYLPSVLLLGVGVVDPGSRQ